MAECHLALKQNILALGVLEGVATRNRTPHINMMLGNLYKLSGMERSAITAYKEVLRVSHINMIQGNLS